MKKLIKVIFIELEMTDVAIESQTKKIFVSQGGNLKRKM